MASEQVKEFTDANFEAEVLNSSEPVLVDFWAPWCGPCRRLAPLIDEMAEHYAGSVKIGKLNIDDHPQAAMKYNISSIPTMLIFKDGQIVKMLHALQSRERLQEVLDEVKA
jgi:thioredoxin 1